MSYMCDYKNKECDHCLSCKDLDNTHFYCENCEEKIEKGEMFYQINNKTLCKDCVDLLYGKIDI